MIKKNNSDIGMDKNKAITNKVVWNCLDILRKNNSNTPDTILFLLSAVKDGFFDEGFLKNENKLDVIRSKMSCDSFYNEIYEVFEFEISNIPTGDFNKILSFLNKIDKTYLRKKYPEIFEYILNQVIGFQKNKTGLITQPIEITKLVIEMARLDKNATVYNPFAGFASFGVLLNDINEYHGQEVSRNTWAIAKLRLKAHNKKDSYKFDLDDSIKNWNNHQKFDLIVSIPPFSSREIIQPRGRFSGHSKNYFSNFLIENGLDSLTENGQLITVLPQTFLFNNGMFAKFRKNLVDNNLIDTIVDLPDGLFSRTGISTCLIIIKKNKVNNSKIRFVDGSSFTSANDSKNKILNVNELLELITDDIENKYLKHINSKDIESNNFDLSVKRYFLKKIEGTKLSDFTSFIRGERNTSKISIKRVHIKDLKENVFDGFLSSSELTKGNDKFLNFSIIEEDCLLLSTRWSSLKPTFFKYTGQPIEIHASITALKLNQDIVDPVFLTNEFTADYVNEQLESYKLGSVQSVIRKSDLKDVVFKLPSLLEQKAKASGIKEVSIKLEKIKNEAERIQKGQKIVDIESSTSLSHILGKPLLGIGSSISVIKSALTKLDPDWKTRIVSKKREFTLFDAFESVNKNLKYIQELVDENTALVNISSFELTEINLLKFLSDYVKNERKVSNESYYLELDIHDDIKNQLDGKVFVNGNSKKLRIVFENLIDNAKRHAFINSDYIERVNIEVLPFTGNQVDALKYNYQIDSKKSYIEIRVSNSGYSFPKDFTLKDYIRKNFGVGETKNKGLGGFEINEILKVHNNKRNALNFISNIENTEFSSTITFIIPLI